MSELDKADQSFKATENGNQSKWRYMKAWCEIVRSTTLIEMKDLGAAKVALQEAEQLVIEHKLEDFVETIESIRDDIVKAEAK
jgi:hypothetical protein